MLLSIAATEGNSNAVRSLLRTGVETDKVNLRGETPLHSGVVVVMKML